MTSSVIHRSENPAPAVAPGYKPLAGPVPATSSDAPLDAPLRLSDRAARYLQAAESGSLRTVTQYGAVLYREDRSGETPSYLSPLEPALVTEGLLRPHEDGRLTLAPAGAQALRAYALHRAELDALPFTLTRNPCRDEQHRDGEPILVLRDAATGREIGPGAVLTDRAGHTVTYLGPTMSSTDGGTTWAPARTARIRYAGYGPMPQFPSELGAVYDAEPRPTNPKHQEEG